MESKSSNENGKVDLDVMTLAEREYEQLKMLINGQEPEMKTEHENSQTDQHDEKNKENILNDVNLGAKKELKTKKSSPIKKEGGNENAQSHDIERMSAENAELRKQRDFLQSMQRADKDSEESILQLKRIISEREDEIQILKKEYDEVKKQLSIESSDRDKVNMLQESITELQRNFKSQQAKFMTRIEELTKENEEENRKGNQELIQTNLKLSNEIKNLRSEKETIHNNLVRFVTSLDLIEINVSKTMFVDKFEEIHTSVMQELIKLKNSVSHLTFENDELKKDILELKKRCITEDTEKEKLSAKQEENERNLHNQIQHLQKTLETLNRNNDEKDEALKKAREELYEKEQRHLETISDLKNHLQDNELDEKYTKEVEYLKKKISKLQSKLSDVSQEKASLSSSMQSITTLLEEKERIIKHHNKKLEELKRDTDTVRRLYKKSDYELGLVKAELQSYKESSSRKRKRIMETSDIIPSKRSKQEKIFIFSGFSDQPHHRYTLALKKRLEKICENLGGRCVEASSVNDENFKIATHICAPKDLRTLKTLVSRITSKIMVTPEYIECCHDQNQWIPTEDPPIVDFLKNKYVYCTPKFSQKNQNKINHVSQMVAFGGGFVIQQLSRADIVLCTTNEMVKMPILAQSFTWEQFINRILKPSKDS